MKHTVEDIAAAFGQFDTIPLDKAEKLIGILESASSKSLLKIYNARVKFCWPVAGRILRQRGVKVGG